MNTYKITYIDGREVIDQANSAVEMVRKYDLATKQNIGTVLTQIELSDYIPE